MNQFLQISDNQVEQINNCCEIVNQWATEKGWNETPDSVQHKAEQIALMHSELSECLEFVRKRPLLGCPTCGIVCECGYLLSNPGIMLPPMDDHVPALTGESAELADVLIRIFHYCGKRGIDLGKAVQLKHQYNITRPYKHGKVI